MIHHILTQENKNTKIVKKIFYWLKKNNKYSIENVCIGDALIISDKKQYKLNYINEIVIRNENVNIVQQPQESRRHVKSIKTRCSNWRCYKPLSHFRRFCEGNNS